MSSEDGMHFFSNHHILIPQLQDIKDESKLRESRFRQHSSRILKVPANGVNYYTIGCNSIKVENLHAYESSHGCKFYDDEELYFDAYFPRKKQKRRQRRRRGNNLSRLKRKLYQLQEKLKNRDQQRDDEKTSHNNQESNQKERKVIRSLSQQIKKMSLQMK